MSGKPTGGPAFPTEVSEGVATRVESGMTLRDYFAAQAMSARMIALGAHTHRTDDEESRCDADTAAAAYRKADAMLAERSK